MINWPKKQKTIQELNQVSPNEFFIWDEKTVKTEEYKIEKQKMEMGLKVVSNIHRPSITAYFPKKELATGTAVIIAPGGSHRELWIEHEGYNPAAYFSSQGIAAFVLKYRLSKEPNSKYNLMDHSLKDIQQAIRYIRSRSKEWNIKTSQVGVMGFSAGGELAGLAAMCFDDGDKNAGDKILQQSSYPNFQALIYPSGTENIKATKHSPPIFLLCGNKDDEIAKGIAEIYIRFKEEGIPAELHIYANVGHGFGVREKNNPIISKWPGVFVDWVKAGR